MNEFLIIDGYNIIHAWPELAELIDEDLEYARDRLVDLMIEFQALTNYRVIIVFDAHQVKGGVGHREIRNGVEVIYSQEGETADSTIEKKVSSYIDKGKVVVATSDWNQQKIIFGKGAARMPARELLDEVLKYTLDKKKKVEKLARSEEKGLASRLNDDIKDILEKMRRQK